MNDSSTPVETLRQWMREFVAARDWEQFHAPKNLSMALAIEAAELMEHFQWITVSASREITTDPAKLGAVREELADVLCYALALANALDIDITAAIRDKMAKNALKYPVDQYRGKYGPEDQ